MGGRGHEKQFPPYPQGSWRAMALISQCNGCNRFNIFSNMNLAQGCAHS